LVAGNLPWPTNNRLARETEISGLSEILLCLQCGRDDPKLALARRHTTLDILDKPLELDPNETRKNTRKSLGIAGACSRDAATEERGRRRA
jgi:hypothetical protein